MPVVCVAGNGARSVVRCGTASAMSTTTRRTIGIASTTASPPLWRGPNEFSTPNAITANIVRPGTQTFGMFGKKYFSAS